MMIQNPSQKPPALSKAAHWDLKGSDVLCAFKIKIESRNSGLGCINTGDHTQIKIMIQTPSQDFKDMDVLCTFKIKIDFQSLDLGCIKDKQPYPNNG